MKYLLFILIISNLLTAQQNNKSVNAVRVSDGTIVVDGNLEEIAWKSAIPADNFLQKDPFEFKNPTEKTEVRFLYDSKSFYIGATMYKDKPQETMAILSRRDNAGNAERIIISIDTYKDNITAYTYAVTAAGVRIDYYHSSDNEYDRDFSFEPVWSARTQIDTNCWTAEFEIPFSQLRFNNIDEQIWGLNINRWNPTNGEDTYWVLIPKNSFGWSSKFGNLSGIKGIVPSARIELLPYLAGNYQSFPQNQYNNPFYKENDFSARGGVDLKMGIGSSVTIDATINPDFGQVEVDPAVVNLTEFETIYDEKRPFFLEGANLFSANVRNYFYSRRIGSAPRFRSSEEHYEMPHFTDILGAAKITGRTNSGFSFAYLSALTQSEQGKFYNKENDSTYFQDVEPMTLYNVLSLQKEIDNNGSWFKFLQTSTERFFNNNILENLLHKRAYSGGLDYLIRFKNSDYEIMGDFGYSYVEGSKKSIELTQKTSTHYFQRPDATHFNLDTTKDYLAGYAASIRFAKKAGKYWVWNTAIGFSSPEFELNDIGVLQKADEIIANGTITFRDNEAGDFIKQYNINLYASNSWNFEKIITGRTTSLSSNVYFTDFSSIYLQSEYSFESFNVSKTRGGPIMKNPSRFGLKGSYTNGWTKDYQYEITSSYSKSYLDDKYFGLSLEFILKTLGRIELTLSSAYSNNIDSRQFINSIVSSNATETYGKRYMFGKIEQNTLSFPIRLNYAFTTDITLELYAEPFISAGKFSQIGELTKPSTYNLFVYGENGSNIIIRNDSEYLITKDNENFTLQKPDFNYISFRSNLVLKWEWTRGSNLFVVWQINKNRYENFYKTVNGDFLSDAFNQDGLSTVALKLTYWFPID